MSLLLSAVLLGVPTHAAAESGWASEYGPGNGVAMHFCTWTVRHAQGCGTVTITSVQTGKSVTVPVVDFCYCLVPGTSHPYRIVDLQFDVVAALGLNVADGLFPVSVKRGGTTLIPNTAFNP